jgi:hypothetical protein
MKIKEKIIQKIIRALKYTLELGFFYKKMINHSYISDLGFFFFLGVGEESWLSTLRTALIFNRAVSNNPGSLKSVLGGY